jgi:hypothetical protein
MFRRWRKRRTTSNHQKKSQMQRLILLVGAVRSILALWRWLNDPRDPWL